MLSVFKCPHCRKLIETNLENGQTIDCPYCEEAFELGPEHAARKGAGNEALFRLAIPVGYVLFVAVPLALTIWYLARRAEEKPKEVVEAPAQVAPGNRNEPRPPARPVRPKKDAAPKADPEDPDDAPAARPGPKPPVPVPPGVTPEPVPPTAPPIVPELAVAPEPRELPEVFVAPEPREIVWKLPPLDYATPWQKVGAADLRVAGVAVARVPIIDTKERVRETAQPMLVVVIEVRMNTASKKRELLSWTHAQNRYMAGFLAGGTDLAHLDLPLGSRVHSGVPFRQPIPPDGQPVRDIMVFATPPEGAGELSIRMDGDRFGEPTDVWVKIPPAAWKK